MRLQLGIVTLLIATLVVAAPAGHAAPWSEARSDEILDKTIRLRLETDLSELDASEVEAVKHLLAAGEIFHELYLDQRHHQALQSKTVVEGRKARRTSSQADKLSELFRLFNGPIAVTPANQRKAFLDVDGTVPGKNVYPWGVSRSELDAFMDEQPGADLLGVRTRVVAANRSNARHYLRTLDKHPVLDALHPGLRSELETIARMRHSNGYHAIPYAVAYADPLMQARNHLLAAARSLRESDRDFSAYLELRALDLLSNDYEAGDAAWVAGEFKKLNAQIGSYETYDDELYGAKSFFSLSLLLKDEQLSRELAAAIGDLQAIENELPYDRHKRVRTDIPVGVYKVIADFGQARGTNTATILPNDADHARKYGRTILLRHNILTEPALFTDTQAAWKAAVNEPFHAHLTMDAGFQRTLWHEIGHYLGVSTDRRGRNLDIALKEYSDLLEEMKADLVSLHAAPRLHEGGYYSDTQLQSLYADGVRRMLQQVKPRREQPYQTMQLMQMNWFLANGGLSFDADTKKLNIHYDRYPENVRGLLRAVLALQSEGDAQAAADFVERYAVWDDKLHGVIAERIRDAVRYRYRLVYYEALGE